MFNSEIDYYLLGLNTYINTAMEKSVPKVSLSDSISKSTNDIIRRFHSEKSRVLSR